MSNELLGEAVKAWRKTKHPRWAALADAAAKASPPLEVVGAGRKKEDTAAWTALEQKKEPQDLPRLVAALRTTSAGEAAERVKVLGKRDDPRLFSALLGVFEDPPWRANVFKDFVRAAIDVLHETRDVRVREAWLDLAPRYKAIIETSVGDWVGTQLARAAKALEGVEPRPLSPADEKRLAELERSLGSATPKRAKVRSDAELLAMIYAVPEDDQPRLVFADALTERGDERGEFISLQLTRAQGRGTPGLLARERAVVEDRKRATAWALPLANGGDFRFERGFPAVVTPKPPNAKKVVGDPAWATVRSVQGLSTLSGKLTLELLEHPAMAHVREVSALSPKVLDALSATPRGWTSVQVQALPSRALLESWPQLTHLGLHLAQEGKLPAGAFTALPKLRSVSTGLVTEYAAEAFASAPQLERLELALPDDQSTLPAELLAPLKRLTSLSLHFFRAARPDLLRRLNLEALSIHAHGLSREELSGYLVECPTLERLSVKGSLFWLDLDVALDLLAGTKVRELHVERDDFEFSLLGDVLELRNTSERAVKPLAAGLRGGKVKSVRPAPERFFEGDALRWTRVTEEDVAFAKRCEALLS